MKKYIRDRVRYIFRFNDPPHKLALAFALGVFIAFSPTIGLHTISCFVLAWMFRLSKIVVFTGALINNPWTIVPLYGSCIWLGMKITGDDAAIPSIAWNEIRISNVYHILKPYLWAYVAGTLVVGVVAAVISYFIFYWAVVRYRKIEHSQGY